MTTSDVAYYSSRNGFGAWRGFPFDWYPSGTCAGVPVSESNVVDRQIRNLRTRLQDDWREPRFIATVSGRGYRFLDTVVKRHRD